MKFQKGLPRPANAGRKKGSLNKKKVYKISDYVAEQGICPAERIVELLEDSGNELKDRERLEGWLDLYSYCHSKPKPEIETEDPNATGEGTETDREITKADILTLVKSEMKEKNGK